MPLLSFGSYSANIQTGSNVFATALPQSFIYLPTNRVILSGGLIYLLLGFLRGVPEKEKRNSARYVILAPGLLGLFLFLTRSDAAVAYAIPLQINTLCFLAWYTFKARRSSARWLAILVSVLLTGVNMIEEVGSGFIMVSLVYGLVVAFPIVVLHRFIQNGVTIRRLMTGLALGMGLPFIPLILFMGLASASLDSYFFALLFFAASAVPFACLVLWNSWARETALGYIQAEPIQPERLWLAEIDNP
jgi:hypothetical protein